MAELTLPECKYSCRCPLSCCSVEYCELTKDWAKEKWNIELQSTGHPSLLFMGSNGCIVEPHLRPFCTLHTCSINSLGFKKNDSEWTTEYFKLRDEIGNLENLIDTYEKM